MGVVRSLHAGTSAFGSGPEAFPGLLVWQSSHGCEGRILVEETKRKLCLALSQLNFAYGLQKKWAFDTWLHVDKPEDSSGVGWGIWLELDWLLTVCD